MDDDADHNPPLRGIHWIFALPMSLWCLSWLLFSGYIYVVLTWHLFTTLKWFSFALLINPCFAIWLGFFSSAAWAPLSLGMLPWGKYGGEMSRGKIVLFILFIPVLLALGLIVLGPYFYPMTHGGEDGTHVFMRFFPILGGKGYDCFGK